MLVAAGDLTVRPDIVFTKARVAAFMDGCFWHSCPEHGTSPISNAAYWMPKLRRNVERDRVVNESLLAAGWSVIRVWEHDVQRDIGRATEAVADAVMTQISCAG
jgi:DNA mismatch endonuclease, patch repair protein